MSFCKYRVLDKCLKDNRICVFSEECYEPEEKQKQTNADRIRAMNDSSLASLLVSIGWDCHFCEEHRRLENEPLLKDEKCDEECMFHCINWLEQPAEVEK